MKYIDDVTGRLDRLRVLQRMTPDARLRAALELSELTRTLFVTGLRRRFPDLSERELQVVFRKRLELCHNRRS